MTGKSGLYRWLASGPHDRPRVGRAVEEGQLQTRSAGAGRSLLAGLTSVLTLALGTGGCPSGGIDTGFVGVTTGGAQDVAGARADIQSGLIPNPDAITVEGFLSEHDIPIPAPENPDGELFASIAVAWRQPFGEVAPMGDLFVGLGTTIDLDSFRRRPQNLVVVVDRSGSMSDSASASDGRSKLSAVGDALNRLVDQLDGNDLLSIVSFNTAWTIELTPTPGDRKDAAREVIRRLLPFGNTNMFNALRRALELALQQHTDGRASRVVLFTDALPNQGPQGSPEFVSLIRDFAAQGVAFTLMGVGADFGDALARDISNVRDANSFFLADAQRIATVFDRDFDFLVTPAAHDLVIEVRIPDEIGVRAVYGVPDYVPGTNGARVRVPTLFFSRREGGGAIVVRLTTAETPTFEEGVTFGALSLAYTPVGGERKRFELELTLPAGISPTADPPYFSDPSARRAAVLLDTALVLKEASKAASEGRYNDAERMLTGFLTYFDQATLGLSDRTDPSSRGLSDERDVLERLLGTVQSPPYDYYYYPYGF